MAQHGRRLLCTMHSDVVPVHFVRGTCTVIHRDNIPNQDEESYRKQPDCFYFNQVTIFAQCDPLRPDLDILCAVLRSISASLL